MMPVKRAAALPIVHQAIPKDVLADPLDDQAFGLGRLGQVRGLRFEFLQRRVGQADAQRIDAAERRVEIAEAVESVSGEGRTGHVGLGQAQFRHDAGVIQREKPRALLAGGGEVDFAPRRGRREGRPAGLFAESAAEAVLPGGLLAFLPDDEGLRRFDHPNTRLSSNGKLSSRSSTLDTRMIR